MLGATRVLFALYAALLIVGGILGFVNKHSTVSLIAGVGVGLLVLAAVYLFDQNRNASLILGIVGAIVVLGGQLPRFIKNPAVWPGGATVVASFLILIIAIAAFVVKPALSVRQ